MFAAESLFLFLFSVYRLYDFFIIDKSNIIDGLRNIKRKMLKPSPKTIKSAKKLMYFFNYHSENLKFKAVMLGNAGVGKSTLASRYITGKIVKEYGPTVGGVFYKK